MDNILQTTFWNAIVERKLLYFEFKFRECIQKWANFSLSDGPYVPLESYLTMLLE